MLTFGGKRQKLLRSLRLNWGIPVRLKCVNFGNLWSKKCTAPTEILSQ